MRKVSIKDETLTDTEIHPMQKLIPLLALTLAVVAVGCANKGKVPKNESVTDIGVAPAAPREPEYAYTGPIAAAPAQPAYYDAAVTQTPGAGGAAGGNSYTVKKGDTLFGIAKTAYGNGNQWQRIAAANPGLSPTTLKAGQTIVLP
jgi:nucleoid-associated protein YgaU